VTANTSKASLNSRLQLDAATIELMLGRPVIGVGLDGASESQWVKSPPENLFLLAWLGGGLFALIGVVMIVASGLREGWRDLRTAEKAVPWDICAGLLISFLSTIVFALASPVLQQRYVWVSVAFLLAVRETQRAAITPAVASFDR
jgi:O-antigen ligase